MQCASSTTDRDGAERLDLVALQGGERRDYHRRPVDELAGDLIDRRLSLSRRHHGEGVAAAHADSIASRCPGRGRLKPKRSRATRSISLRRSEALDMSLRGGAFWWRRRAPQVRSATASTPA
jgi:hypothetical protein